VCAHPAYLAARGIPQRPEILSSFDCIAFEVLGSPRSWTFHEGKEKISIAVRPRLIVSTAEAGIDAAIAGVGITRALSYQVEKAVGRGELKIVLEGFEPPPWPVHIVHHGVRALPLKLRTFRDFVVPRLRERLSRLNNQGGLV
ncbi:MAG TPA: LysR substrate-binding domain-containing protein, partial [Oligoflexus sp.]|uniref:LysR substrate-binding domain-containing protein n=1 Tax=Oligoflexus sp. TaxID=1971216 RepID=UPI002D7EFE63